MKKKNSILIIDDAVENIDTLGKMLEQYEARAATSGEKGLRIAQGDNPPDLILLDILMPEMSGYEVCEKLKADPKTKDIPIIFITVLGDIEDELKGFALGSVDYITKPFTPATVLARVKTHLELKQHRDHLEEMVKERTDQLFHAERLATIGLISASVAHELNNPISGILQNIQNMQSRIDADDPKNQDAAAVCNIKMENIHAYLEKRKISKMMETIYNSSIRAAKVVDNVLNFSRRSASEFIEQSIKTLLEKAIDLAESDYSLIHKYDFREIKIIREYSENLPDVPCDSNQIQQVFFNILKNGAQAMAQSIRRRNQIQKHSTEFPTFVLRLMPENDMIRIEIENNGPHLDEETRERIFEPFFTTKGPIAGTGLGLSLSYTIITENHGGAIIVESEPEKNTKFIIKLPLKKK